MEQQNITGNITAPDFEALRSERKVHVCWERVGNCLWHTNCADDAHGSGIMKQGCRSEEHTSELQSLMRISYAVFCLKKKNETRQNDERTQKDIIQTNTQL